MNILRRSRAVFGIAVSLSFLLYSPVSAKGPLVSEFGTTKENSNKHNLSAVGRTIGTTDPSSILNQNTYKATNDPAGNPKGRQVCIFCHTPHNSNNTTQQTPLWNRRLSSMTFSRYSSGTLQIRINAAARTPANYDVGAQPDGVSKLCLSCHDGTIGLGDVINGGPIAMVGADKITGRALFNNNKMKLGHHPVSFVYNAGVMSAINASGQKAGYALPSITQVKLDKNGKMQCTTCHNPHQNQTDDTNCYLTAGGVGPCAPAPDNRKVAPFWVYHNGSDSASTDHDSVCKTCHPMGEAPYNAWPWP